MKMQAGLSVLALLLAGCATTTSDWAVMDSHQSDRVELVSQPGTSGNDAKAQQTALRACESRGYGFAFQLDERAMACSSASNSQCDADRKVVTFECRAAMDEYPVVKV